MAKKNPFSEVADEADKSPSPEPEGHKDPVIDLDAIEQEEADKVDVEPGESRQAKRNKRTWMNQDERDRLDRERTELQQRNDQLFQQMNSLMENQRHLLTQQQTQTSTPQEDPVIASLKRERMLLNKQYELVAQSGKLNPAERDRMEAEAMDLDLKIQRAVVQDTIRSSGLQHQPQQQSPQATAMQSYIMMSHPDVDQALRTNQNALRYADAMQNAIAATGRNPMAKDVIDEVMEATRRQFRLGNHNPSAPRKPDPSTSSRMQGAPRGALGGNGSSSQGSGRQVVMTKDMQKMARAYFPGKPDAEAFKSFAKMHAKDTDD